MVLNLALASVFGSLAAVVRFEPQRILRDLAKAFTYFALALYLLGTHKVDVTSIVATSALVTAVVGFSLQDVLGNVMGGLALNLDRSIRAGDWVKFGDMAGIVREIGWRHTSIESRNGDRFIVPNNQLMKNVVMLQGKRWDGTIKERRWVRFNVDFRYSPLDVINVVTEALTRQPIEGVAADPPPHVIFSDFRDSWGHYAARYWLTELTTDDYFDSLVRARVFAALRRAQIPLSIPTSTIFMQKDRRERVRLAEQRRARNLRTLGAVPIVPILVGHATDGDTAAAMARALAPLVASGTVLVVSTDFTHHGQAYERDHGQDAGIEGRRHARKTATIASHGLCWRSAEMSPKSLSIASQLTGCRAFSGARGSLPWGRARRGGRSPCPFDPGKPGSG